MRGIRRECLCRGKSGRHSQEQNMPVAAKKRDVQEGLRRNEKKWTAPLMDAGWSVLPNVILERQHVLDLDAVDVNILLHLVKHWWFPEKLPHPSKQTIADCMGIDASTVRRRIKRLEERGLIERRKRFDQRKGQQTNEYDLSGLVAAASHLPRKCSRPAGSERSRTRRRASSGTVR